jgi:cell wall assembly regulator SMI1
MLLWSGAPFQELVALGAPRVNRQQNSIHLTWLDCTVLGGLRGDVMACRIDEPPNPRAFHIYLPVFHRAEIRLGEMHRHAAAAHRTFDVTTPCVESRLGAIRAQNAVVDSPRCSRYESGMSEVIARLDGIMLAKTERAAAKQAGVAGVLDESFGAFANELGLPLPPLFRELYAWHGGDPINSFDWTLGGDDSGWFLEPLTSILATRRLWQERAAELRDASADDAPTLFNAGFWHPSFVPFMSDRSATEIVVATAPCFGGPAGQIVSFDYKGGSWWRVLGPSLEVFLETMAELMETNASFYSLDEIQKARFPGYRVVALEASMLRDPSRFDGPPPRPLS